MLTTEQLDELKAANPRGVVHLIGKDQRWEAVFRKPQGKEWKRFKSMVHNPAQAFEANDTLARAIVVHPSRDAFDALLDDYPAIPETLGNSAEFQAMVGVSVEEDRK